jgi:hypothetical protein
VVLLLNPEAQTITVHRPNNLITTLVSSQTLTLPELLPGWELLTSPVFIIQTYYQRNWFQPQVGKLIDLRLLRRCYAQLLCNISRASINTKLQS